MKLEIRKFEIDDISSLWELMNAFEYVPISIELHRQKYQFDEQIAQREDEYLALFAGIFEERIVGFCRLEKIKTLFIAQVGVIPEARGKGLGTTLLAVVLELARAQNVEKLYCQVDNSVVHDKKFLDKHGIKTSKRNILSKLEITNFSPVEYQLLEQQLLLKGYDFAYLADFQDTAETRENLYQLVRQSVEDDAGFDGEFETLEEFNDRIWQIYWNARDFWCFALYRSSFVALAGTRLVGVSTLWETQLTGVARNHRGLGLAQVVKMKSILNSWEYGAETIKTGNDSGNLAMIAINFKMGFVHTGDRYSLELSL